MAWSNSARRRVEEDTAREVGIAPLCEGCLLLEVSLDVGEILCIQPIMILLVCCTEMLVVEGGTILESARHHALLQADRLSAAVGGLRTALLKSRKALELAATSSLGALLLSHDTRCLCARLHDELFSLALVVVVVIDQDSDFAGVAPLVDIPTGLTLNDLRDLCVSQTLGSEFCDPLRQFVLIPSHG